MVVEPVAVRDGHREHRVHLAAARLAVFAPKRVGDLPGHPLAYFRHTRFAHAAGDQHDRDRCVEYLVGQLLPDLCFGEVAEIRVVPLSAVLVDRVVFQDAFDLVDVVPAGGGALHMFQRFDVVVVVFV